MAQAFQSYLEQTRRRVTEIDVAELVRRRSGVEAPVIIDVREADETATGVIDGARLIPRGLLELDVEAVVPRRETPVVVYCAGGTRSALAAASLMDLGYTSVASLAGGFAAYVGAGYGPEVRRRLTASQTSRYARHLSLPEIGEAGQLKLLGAKVLCVGAGGLGSPAALYLAAAGVGTIGVVDSDVVDASNLQRQVLHTEGRIGWAKVDSAERAIADLNRDVVVRRHPERLVAANAVAVIAEYDVVIDGSDNFATRYVLNDAAVAAGKPVVHGAIHRFDGQTTVFLPNAGPCYRCLFPDPPPPEAAPNCRDAGVLGVLPGVIGVIEALEAIKLVLGIGTPLVGRLLMFDALALTFRELAVSRDPSCPACGTAPTVLNVEDVQTVCRSGSP